MPKTAKQIVDEALAATSTAPESEHAALAQQLRQAGLYVEDDGNGDQADFITYSVYPRKNWEKYVKADRRGDWEDLAGIAGDRFAKITTAAGYEVGDSGGGNFSMVKEGDDNRIFFCFWGNPYHG